MKVKRNHGSLQKTQILTESVVKYLQWIDKEYELTKNFKDNNRQFFWLTK